MTDNPAGVQWTLALLRDNPFRVIPPRSPRLAVWADLEETRQRFDSILGAALTSSANQLITVVSDWGGGKTHAAQWYRITDRIPATPQVRQTHTVYLRMPKKPESATQDFYRTLLEMVNISAVRSSLAESIGNYGEESVRQHLDELGGTGTITRAFLALAEDVSDETLQLLDAFFLDSCTRTELRRLGLPRNISTKDHFLVLGIALQCLIGLEESETPAHHSRVILWIDEVEDLLYFSARYHRPFTQGLRDLFDRVSAFFTLVLNLTYAAPESERGVYAILGEALRSRITHQVTLGNLTEDGLLIYVGDLLAAFRVSDLPKAVDPLYPFTKDSVLSLASRLDDPRPRAVNRSCAEIISSSIREGLLGGDGQGRISSEYVESAPAEFFRDK